MDGGNLTFYREAFHARSLDSGVHPWDTRAKAVHERVRHDIPHGWRISVESMWARRSVAYDTLPGVVLCFGVWDEHGTLLSWDDTTTWAELLDLPLVPVLYRGTSLPDALAAWSTQRDEDHSEGFVVRDAGPIAGADFTERVAKWVRPGHVRTDATWRSRDDFATNTFA